MNDVNNKNTKVDKIKVDKNKVDKGIKKQAKEVKCWCCEAGAYIIVLGQYPMCMECGGQYFRGNRLIKQAFSL